MLSIVVSVGLRGPGAFANGALLTSRLALVMRYGEGSEPQLGLVFRGVEPVR